MRDVGLRCIIVGVGILFCGPPSAAADAPESPAAGGFDADGYLRARYAYVGSSSPATDYSGMRVTGNLRLSALAGKLSLRYRSHHWLSFERPGNSYLASPFENRNIVQAVSLETENIILPGLKTTIGRFLPALDYAASTIVDGGGAAYERGRIAVSGAGGRIVDSWNGESSNDGTSFAGQVRYESAAVTASAAFHASSLAGLRQRELPAGVLLKRANAWLDAHASWDFEASDLARAGASLSLRGAGRNLGISFNHWRNTFDQRSLTDAGQKAILPRVNPAGEEAAYQDIRLSASLVRGSWSLRGSAGVMLGDRSGWRMNAYVLAPSFAGLRASVGVQATRSDFIEFVSLDASVATQAGSLALQLRSQTRSYQWRPKLSGYRTIDNYSEIAAEYPLSRHISASAAAGGFFRSIGVEGFKPQAELRFVARL